MIDVFIAYSHFDLSYKDELKKFLRPLLREERITLWDDFDIEAGEDWNAKIKERLYGADLVLLLVSADSLASEYFYSKEVKVSLERHARGETKVVPVILRHCDWTATPLGDLEVLPEKGRPVVDWPTRDQAFLDVVSGLRKVVAGLELKRKNAGAEAEAQRQFQAACEAAGHLYEKKNWREAALAYGSAVAAYRPGFEPDVNSLKGRLAECERYIQAEKDAEQQRIQSEAAARKEQEKREKKPAPQKNYQVNAPSKPKEWMIEVPEAGSSSTGTSNRGFWLSIGASALLIVILVIWRPWSGKKDVGRVPNTNENTTQPNKGTEPATMPENRQTVPSQPGTESTKNPSVEESERRLTQKRVADLLKEANAYIQLDEKPRARITLQKVLLLDPNNAEAKTKLNSLK